MNNKITGYLSPKHTPKRNRSNSSPELNKDLSKRVKPESMAQVGSMTVEQLKQVFSELLDSKQLATKEDIVEIDKKIQLLQIEHDKINRELENQKVINKNLASQVEYLLQQSKRNKLIFYGIVKDEKSSNYVESVRDICTSLLKAEDNISITSARPLGKPTMKKRPLAVEFQNQKDVESILRKSRLLKDTGINIQPDLTISQRQIRKKLLFIRKKLKEINPNQPVSVYRNYLYVNNHRFYWNNGLGLYSGENDGKSVLRALYNFDFTQVISKLINEDSNSLDNTSTNSSNIKSKSSEEAAGGRNVKTSA